MMNAVSDIHWDEPGRLDTLLTKIDPAIALLLNKALNGGELDGRRVLKRESVAMMMRNHLPPELTPITPPPLGNKRGYGQGFGGVVMLDVRICHIEDMDEEIGDDDFLQRGLERLDQPVRQATNETDRVGDKQLLVATQGELPRGRIERREKFVGREDVRAGERIKEG